MRCEEGVQLHCFACGYPVVPALFDEEIILSPLDFINIKEFSKKLKLAFSTLFGSCLAYPSISCPKGRLTLTAEVGIPHLTGSRFAPFQNFRIKRILLAGLGTGKEDVWLYF